MSEKVKIGDFTRKLMMTGKLTSKEVIAKVLEKFPDSQIDEKHIAWYKWDMKRKNIECKMKDGRKKAAPKKAEKKVTPKRTKKTALEQVKEIIASAA